MSVAVALAAVQLFLLSGGQLARAPEKDAAGSAAPGADDEESVRSTRAAPAPQKDEVHIPAPLPLLPAMPPPTVPIVYRSHSLDRVRTSEGREHVGRILKDFPNGIEFENERGERYPIAVSVIVAVERGDETWKLPVPQVEAIDADAVRKELGLAFDIYELEREKAQLTWGEKAVVCAVGIAATIVGFAAIKGETGRVVGIVGAIGAGGGGVALGVNAVRSVMLSRRIDEARAQLDSFGGPPPVVSGVVVQLPALALKF
jgi:hypothetical protein